MTEELKGYLCLKDEGLGSSQPRMEFVVSEIVLPQAAGHSVLKSEDEVDAEQAAPTETNATASRSKRPRGGGQASRGRRSQSRQRSIVWQHFRRDAACAVCLHCPKTEPTVYKVGSGNTSTLIRHLRSRHPLAWSKSPKAKVQQDTNSTDSARSRTAKASRRRADQPQQQSASDSLSARAKVSRAKPSRQHEIDQLLMKSIVASTLPLDILSTSAFQEFVHALDHRYSLPSPKHLTTVLLPSSFRQMKAEVKSKVASADWIAVSVDVWTNVANVYYMVVRGHLIEDGEGLLTANGLACCALPSGDSAPAVVERLFDILSELECQSKVIGVVVNKDHQHIVEAISKTNTQHVGCLAHTINTLCQNAMVQDKKFATIRERVSAIVKLLHINVKAKDTFDRCHAEIMPLPAKAILQESRARWNSTYAMFMRFLELKDVVNAFLTATDDPSVRLFCESDWDLINEALTVLRPLYQATVELSASHFVTASTIIPLVKALVHHYKSMEVHQLQTLQKEILQGINKHFEHIELNEILSLSTVCDPRFKSAGFRDPLNFVQSLELLKMSMAKQKEIQKGASEKPAEARLPTNSDLWAITDLWSTSDLWASHDTEVAQKKLKSTGVVDEAEDEVKNFMQETNLPRDKDPIQWWLNAGKNRYPLLYPLARQYLIVPATSVPAIEVFSAAGYDKAERRKWLYDGSASTVVFCNSNLQQSEPKTSPLNLEEIDAD